MHDKVLLLLGSCWCRVIVIFPALHYNHVFLKLNRNSDQHGLVHSLKINSGLDLTLHYANYTISHIYFITHLAVQIEVGVKLTNINVNI